MSWEMFPEPGEGAIGFAVIGTGMVCLGLLFLGWFVWVCCYWVDLSGFAVPGLVSWVLWHKEHVMVYHTKRINLKSVREGPDFGLG